ncbi:hypothetical protein [Sporomusa sp.]|uniref:hypothetical protein n=1 Tax=Sporomusa sp. TaxID=2078658 RepID=UPI002BA52629|nr:hypothetical protein [Sporomusa sp.]HWR44473.1 hypothetical protein [Sporomusa sp.]
MNHREVKAILARKLEIIQKINTNSETQSRFIRRREMRGLNRLLRERAKLIDELVTVSDKLKGDSSCKCLEELKVMANMIEIKQKEALNAFDQVLQEALFEHKRIAAELSNIKVLRQVKGRYVHQWTVMAAGQRFNAKG